MKNLFFALAVLLVGTAFSIEPSETSSEKKNFQTLEEVSQYQEKPYDKRLIYGKISPFLPLVGAGIRVQHGSMGYDINFNYSHLILYENKAIVGSWLWFLEGDIAKQYYLGLGAGFGSYKASFFDCDYHGLVLPIYGTFGKKLTENQFLQLAVAPNFYEKSYHFKNRKSVYSWHFRPGLYSLEISYGLGF